MYFGLKSSALSPLGALLPFLGAVCCGEVRVSSAVYDTVRLPCWFPFIQGVDDLIAVWEKAGKERSNLQVYKFVKGQNDLSNQHSQFRGRTDLSGDVSQGKLDLILSGVTMTDDGVYYCRAANRINHGDNTVILSVSALPPQRIDSLVDGDVTLVPKYFGVPTEINWKLDSSIIVQMELVSPGPHFYRLADRASLYPNGTLTIRNLRKEDSGIYKSEVLVNHYIQETEIWLTVLDRVSKPAINVSSSGQHINLPGDIEHSRRHRYISFIITGLFLTIVALLLLPLSVFYYYHKAFRKKNKSEKTTPLKMSIDNDDIEFQKTDEDKRDATEPKDIRPDSDYSSGQGVEKVHEPVQVLEER